MNRLKFILPLFFILLIGCTNNDADTQKVPDLVSDLQETAKELRPTAQTPHNDETAEMTSIAPFPNTLDGVKKAASLYCDLKPGQKYQITDSQNKTITVTTSKSNSDCIGLSVPLLVSNALLSVDAEIDNLYWVKSTDNIQGFEAGAF